ncbi:MAG: iron transporter [Hamadaea sp.]|uniref:iron uptake transporter permease EfeU n=1 Tax=Hamadaea sp. TaxID=2024425 RepID=UPI00180D11F2|nr:iron uptake transporter permease EfeU [Hamadaea sp.]NUR70764.1 iron transporter [Hamadaea sp.]NUT23922.1 iron transporter [Hamadaea sp.]
MSGNVFLPAYLTGLREGLEAALVVTILVGFLVKSDRRRQLPLVWAGVGVAAALSVGVVLALGYASEVLTGPGRELFEAITSVVAVVFVTWMIFWMRKAARSIAGTLRAQLTDAIKLGPIAVVVVAFLAVAREGVETAVIFMGIVQQSPTAWPVVGITGGLLTAAALGFGLYASILRINLTKFFTWTGLLLILVAAGIFKYGVHDFQEAGVLPGLSTKAFDISGVLDPTTWYASLLSGMFNITPEPTVLEVVAWVAYVVPVLILFLLPTWVKRPAADRQPTQPAPTSAR